MVRLFNFVRKDFITDINGNIYSLDDILPILSKLSCFGITIQELIERRTHFVPNLNQLKKNYHKALEDYDNYPLDEKYKHVLVKYNELNPDSEIRSVNKSSFDLKEHYSEEDKEFFKKNKLSYRKDKKYESKLEKISDEEFEKYSKAHGPIRELWEEIVFCKLIKIINPGKYEVEIVPFLLPKKTESGLKVGSRITINPQDINYLNTYDYCILKYMDQSVINIETTSCILPCITNWMGCPYKDRDRAVALLEEEDIVRIQIKVKNNISEKESNFCWYMKILKFDKNKEWFIGLSLSMYKNFEEHYDYESPMKVGCLYYFHKKSILEIPIDENWNKYEEFKKELNFNLKRGMTGSVAPNEEINVSCKEVLSKFVSN